MCKRKGDVLNNFTSKKLAPVVIEKLRLSFGMILCMIKNIVRAIKTGGMGHDRL